jgi:hypothetical protein
VLLVLAWVVGNPAFAAPDEPAQYIRALALADGKSGRVATYPQAPGTHMEEGFRRLSRVVDVPGELVPEGQLPCFAFFMATPANCTPAGTPFALSPEERLALDPADGLPQMIARLDVVSGPNGPELATTSYQAVYPPAALGVAGLAGRLGWSPTSGLLFARLASAAVCLAFLAAGWVWLLGGPDRQVLLVGPRLVGGLLALTPMAVFLAATVSGSGMEIAAAFAWVAGLLRAGRGPVSAATTVGIAVAGVGLTTARQFGPAWLAVSVLAVAASGGLPVARRRLAEQPRAAAGGGAALILALAFILYWDLAVFPGAPERSEPATLRGLTGQSVGDLGRLLRETVGVFGWLDAYPPLVVPLGWGALVVALTAVAVVVGRRSDRRVVGGVALGVVGTALLVTTTAYVQQGGAQGRWLLPAAVALPLVGGEVVARRWRSGGSPTWPVPRASIVAAAGAVAALQGVSLWANARRHAVGNDGPLMFAGVSRWAPPGGWWPVAALAAGGLVALVAGAAGVARADGTSGEAAPAGGEPT